jgi:hypothetical protein
MTHAPADKASLLDRIRAARAALEQAIGRLDEAELNRPGADGWSTKDHLYHIAAWLRKTTAVLNGQAGHTALGVSYEMFNRGDEDGINASLQQRSASLPLAEVLTDFRATHKAILDFIEAQPEERLAQLYAANDPDDQRRVIDAIASNTYEHDEEHLGWIRQRMKDEL